MAEHECRLIGEAEIAAHRQHALAFHLIAEHGNGGEVAAQRQLVGSKQGPRGDRELTYAQLAEKLAAIGVEENERNLNNKISRGGFTAAFFLECLIAIGCHDLRLDS